MCNGGIRSVRIFSDFSKGYVRIERRRVVAEKNDLGFSPDLNRKFSFWESLKLLICGWFQIFYTQSTSTD